MLAYVDWLVHFLIAPDKHELLARNADHRQMQRLLDYAVRARAPMPAVHRAAAAGPALRSDPRGRAGHTT